jgi:phenylpropionate dioxygenase-like ring-hydroxylating dioxygenase large terminal subunit
MFLRNSWYVAAWSSEVGDQPTPRVILDEPVVLFRKQDGSVAALEDRCAHRHAPLHLGRVVGNGIQCGYHGLVFNAEGRCTQVPGRIAFPVRPS